MKNPHDIIIRPWITEKTMDMQQQKKYVFIVDRKANKTEIKNALESIFGVKVAKVNTINVRGKVKRMGRFEGKRPDWKKAIVTLTDDSKTIEFFEAI
ncbi:MAG: 50S ribosomal protein L23 [Tepidanaerobacter acetatoxydans]|jgi:large subunit ribosomal protein L23|uniref:Large ribosomal subunit protein uL23 n=1 Tax=Tepidanaerobacter acetatoxydans (strain DSM 21804 / JCM 16047 / Re1) TaxID=1209989 RepID=F4LST7_TEPAE|nr:MULTISPECIES: 50S ribosomal protein L23 [Tepidanaerobacter]AEE90400.1 Ribosomal protein L25/L23 [Tepidanaerobacter acetatoxydans Re1]NLU09400.1 50S ribosomal protein L23 [Tepidanaerobacter acetatoxydans]CDI40323.1 ribosomal protein L23 [Tepidanaerobacter acetatoxydans Re1]